MSAKRKGIVTKSTGNIYTVRTDNNEIIYCNLKGQFRIHGIKTTNPIAVGDHILFIKDKDQDMGLITDIKERKNYITRKSTNLSRISHILAANIDRFFLIVSLSQPRTPLGFIDRFLTAAEAFRIESIIVFNKIDIYNKKEMEELKQLKSLYEKIGYTCVNMSNTTGEGVEEVKALMQNKTSFIGGISGVGKSTIINSVDSSLNLKIGDISEYYKKEDTQQPLPKCSIYRLAAILSTRPA